MVKTQLSTYGIAFGKLFKKIITALMAVFFDVFKSIQSGKKIKQNFKNYIFKKIDIKNYYFSKTKINNFIKKDGISFFKILLKLCLS